MMECKLYSGFYKPEENKTCDECGVEIGDYTIYKGVIRCVGCWIEFDIKQFDDAFPDGVYAIARSPEEPRVKVKALYEYCRQKGILPENLTPEDIKRFLVSGNGTKGNGHWDEKV